MTYSDFGPVEKKLSINVKQIKAFYSSVMYFDFILFVH